jgi:hypothetical protein
MAITVSRHGWTRMARCAARMKRRFSGSRGAWQARRSKAHEQTDGKRPAPVLSLACVTPHPCGAKRHPRSSVFPTPSPSGAKGADEVAAGVERIQPRRPVARLPRIRHRVGRRRTLPKFRLPTRQNGERRLPKKRLADRRAPWLAPVHERVVSVTIAIGPDTESAARRPGSTMATASHTRWPRKRASHSC